MARDREVLAHRVADEAVVGQDAAQVDMALEDDAVEVEGLALEPVGRAPDVGDAMATSGTSSSGAKTLHAHALVVRDRQQVRRRPRSAGRPRGGPSSSE